MRSFPYITVGKILQELKKDGVNISRAQFYKLEEQKLFISQRTINNWRVYSREEAEIIKHLIKDNYRIEEE